jgi:hypothetical protein
VLNEAIHEESQNNGCDVEESSLKPPEQKQEAFFSVKLTCEKHVIYLTLQSPGEIL